MRPPAAEKALRRLVTQLASVEPDDVELVLEALDPAQRLEVRDLLADYAAPDIRRIAPPLALAPDPEPDPEPEEDLEHLAGLSPWLSDRVAAKGAPARFQMTPVALAALNAAARALPAEAAFMLAPAEAARRTRSANPFLRLFAVRSPAR